MTENQTHTKEPFDFDREFSDFKNRIMDIVPDELVRRIEDEDEQEKWNRFAHLPLAPIERIERYGRARTHRKVGGSAISVAVDKKPSKASHIQVMHIPTPGDDAGMFAAESALAHSRQVNHETVS